MPHSHFISVLCKKNAETALFLNDFPDNSLMHVDRNYFIFAHIAGWKNQKLQNKSFSLWTQNPRKFLKKRRTTRSAGLLHVTYWENYSFLYFYKWHAKWHKKYINMWFNRLTTGRNYSGEQKVNFETPVPFSKWFRVKIYCNILVTYPFYIHISVMQNDINIYKYVV